jgi:three-Cys-motif partner protein
MPTDFHKAPKAWAQIKHSILGNYLSLFLGKLGFRGDPIYYVDGFAGPGRLEDGSDGSPLVAAKLAASPAQASRQGILRCINVEADPETFANLKLATAEFERSGQVTNHPGTFTEVLPRILTEIGNYTAFFFIDPFGTEGAELETIKAIARRVGKTEILVRYDDTRVKRLIMWATHNEASYDEAHRKTSAAFRHRVAQLTDEQAAALVQSALESEAVPDRDELIQGYVRQVKRVASLRYALSYPIRNPITRGHRYFLVHFCKHPDGYTYMANFMAKVDRSVEQPSSDLFQPNPPQMEFMAINKHLAEEKRREAVEQIVRALPTIFVQNGWLKRRVQNRDVFAAIVDEFGWKVLRSEYLAALRQLETAGHIHVESGKDEAYTHIH